MDEIEIDVALQFGILGDDAVDRCGGVREAANARRQLGREEDVTAREAGRADRERAGTLVAVRGRGVDVTVSGPQRAGDDGSARTRGTAGAFSGSLRSGGGGPTFGTRRSLGGASCAH